MYFSIQYFKERNIGLEQYVYLLLSQSIYLFICLYWRLLRPCYGHYKMQNVKFMAVRECDYNLYYHLNIMTVENSSTFDFYP